MSLNAESCLCAAFSTMVSANIITPQRTAIFYMLDSTYKGFAQNSHNHINYIYCRYLEQLYNIIYPH